MSRMDEFEVYEFEEEELEENEFEEEFDVDEKRLEQLEKQIEQLHPLFDNHTVKLSDEGFVLLEDHKDSQIGKYHHKQYVSKKTLIDDENNVSYHYLTFYKERPTIEQVRVVQKMLLVIGHLAEYLQYYLNYFNKESTTIDMILANTELSYDEKIEELYWYVFRKKEFWKRSAYVYYNEEFVKELVTDYYSEEKDQARAIQSVYEVAEEHDWNNIDESLVKIQYEE